MDDSNQASSPRVSPVPGVRTGRNIGLGFKTSPQDVSWATLDRTWATAAELDVFDSAWMNDHLMDPRFQWGGSSFESVTLLAALAQRVPNLWLGHGVLSNTFRHPAITAKAATVLDHVTGGRYILGLGAGWHEAEHRSMGIELPAIGERIDRLASAVEVVRAMFSSNASQPPGVTRQDPYYPLSSALNDPAPIQLGGPPIWLGGQKPRGLRLAAGRADGWLALSGKEPPIPYFAARYAVLHEEMERVGRDPSGFAFAASVRGDGSRQERREAVSTGAQLVRNGATHIIVGISAAGGAAALRVAADEVAEPILELVG